MRTYLYPIHFPEPAAKSFLTEITKNKKFNLAYSMILLSAKSPIVTIGESSKAKKLNSTYKVSFAL